MRFELSCQAGVLITHRRAASSHVALKAIAALQHVFEVQVQVNFSVKWATYSTGEISFLSTRAERGAAAGAGAARRGRHQKNS